MSGAWWRVLLTISVTFEVLFGVSCRGKFSRVQMHLGRGWSKGTMKTVMLGVEKTCQSTSLSMSSCEIPDMR